MSLFFYSPLHLQQGSKQLDELPSQKKKDIKQNKKNKLDKPFARQKTHNRPFCKLSLHQTAPNHPFESPFAQNFNKREIKKKKKKKKNVTPQKKSLFQSNIFCNNLVHLGLKSLSPRRKCFFKTKTASSSFSTNPPFDSTL